MSIAVKSDRAGTGKGSMDLQLGSHDRRAEFSGSGHSVVAI